jgi:serine O-acetyltransferase
MIKTKQDLRYYKEQDAKVNGYRGGVKRLFSEKYRFLVLLREIEYLTNNPSLLNKVRCAFKKIRFRRVSMKLGYSIQPNCFGPGLSLPHYGTIIVNGNARIGANCRLHCSTNIGASAGGNKAPIIGDNCYIGPGAILFGEIEIPNNTTIGANATVNKSFTEEYTAIAGTPAKVVKTDMPNWLQFNKVKM